MEHPVFTLLTILSLPLFWGGLGVGILSKDAGMKKRGWNAMGIGFLLYITVQQAALRGR